MAIKHRIKFNTEVVNGLCPECNQDTILVSVVPEFYRCSLCVVKILNNMLMVK